MAFVFIFRENWKKNLSICNETPKFCDLLVLFCLNVLCNYYVIFFWRDRISPNPCAIFILFWWVKNECLWHSVRTPNRDIEVCRICEPLKTFLKKTGNLQESISPNPCAIFYFVWWVKNECLWHSVKTPNRDMDNKWVAEKSFYIFFKLFHEAGALIL